MLSTFSHRQLPKYINPRKFAHLGAKINAGVAISEFSRLSDLLADTDGEALVELVFSTDQQNNCQLTGKAVANLPLICQRCLEPFNLPTECELKLMMVSTNHQADNLQDCWEPVFVDDGEIDLHQLIEDEFLLALPLVTYHQQDCVTVDVSLHNKPLINHTVQPNKLNGKTQRINPFGVLKDLKSH